MNIQKFTQIAIYFFIVFLSFGIISCFDENNKGGSNAGGGGSSFGGR